MWAQRIAPIDEASTARALSRAPGFAWLDSQQVDARDGRYSFLAAWPDRIVHSEFGTKDPFAALEGLGRPTDSVNPEGPKPQEVPEWIGFIGYDAYWCRPVRGEPAHARQADSAVAFRRYPALVAIDHLNGETWIVGDDQSACAAFASSLESLPQASPAAPTVGALEVDDAEQHRAAIEQALQHIARGDVYEVNLARRWSAEFEGPAFGLWEAMRDASQVPLGAFLSTERGAVLACTMERFIRWHAESRSLVTRPIKGTIVRKGNDPEARARLVADPKERAEHAMIVDLMRNDLSRVAAVGSVRVNAPMTVEPFTGLYHLVSTVSCVTKDDVTLQSIVEATFPPGSVTGAPKVRALEIIETLEQHPRGVYCGAVGFVDRDGGLSLAVAIRTATVGDNRVEYWAGGGIVEASDPGREVEETELKARVFLDALEAIRRRA
ncbi:MAG: anthranilate synthase component I family protein [Myxococcota bacterium]